MDDKDIKELFCLNNTKVENALVKETNKVEENKVETFRLSRTYVDSKELDEIYKPIDRAIKKLIAGYSNAVFVKGSPAIGKSVRILRNLLKTDFTEITGDVSEAMLYRLLFNNKDRIIYFRDVAKLLRGMNSLDTLKAVTELEEKRIICKNNYSKQQSDLPDSFLFTGKIVFDFNSLQGIKLKEDFEALLTRGEYIDFNLSKEDIIKVMFLLCKNEEEKEITSYLVEIAPEIGNELNLRTQFKAFGTFNFSKVNSLDWKKEVKEELNRTINPISKMLYKIIGTKIVEQSELVKYLISINYASSVRSANRKIEDWLYLGLIYQNGNLTHRKLSINPIIDLVNSDTTFKVDISNKFKEQLKEVFV